MSQTPAERIAKVIRRRLLWWAERGAEYTPCVALSGGVDSCAALAALMQVGAKPIIVSYTPSTHESTDFEMARQTAKNLGLKFKPAVVNMGEASLERMARAVIALGFTSKIQVESLAPMLLITKVAAGQGASHVYTGDQSDGYFCLSRWASHAYDMKHGGATHTHARNDTTSERIDGIRTAYYEADKSCSGAVDVICRTHNMRGVFPFRDRLIFQAFLGTLWREVNKPRVKEPIRLAFADWFTDDRILTRRVQVNLHKGDSRFGDTMGEALMARHPEYRSPKGVYSAIARGDI